MTDTATKPAPKKTTSKKKPPFYKVVDIDPENRQEWLEWRKGGVGASDAGALMGVSPWASAVSVYAEKIDPRPPVELDGEHLLWGHLLEDPILDEFGRRQGLTVGHRQLVVENAEYPFMRATPDGLVLPHNKTSLSEAIGVTEVKVSGDYSPWKEDEVPLHYQAQVHWQLAVTGLPRGWIIALFNAKKMVAYPIEADPGLNETLVEIAVDFWNRVETRTPPPADAHQATKAAIARMWPQHTEDTVAEVDPDLVEAVRNLRARHKEVEALKDEAENMLKMAMGDAEAAVTTIDGVEVQLATWKTQTKRTVNQASVFRALGLAKNERDLYMNIGSSRVLRLKK